MQQNNSPKRENLVRGQRAETSPVDDAINIPKEDPEAVVGSGVVTDCFRLNVRKEPNPDAEVLAVIDFLSDVTVDMNASTDAFYKVRTADGVDGFCMKKYIALRR